MKDRLIQMTRSRAAKILWWLVLTVAMAVFSAMAYLSFLGVDMRAYDPRTKSYWETSNVDGYLRNIAIDTVSAWAQQGFEGTLNPATPGFFEVEGTAALPYELYYVDEYGTKKQEIYTSDRSEDAKRLVRTYYLLYPEQKNCATLGRVHYRDGEIVSVESLNNWNAVSWDPKTNEIELHPENVESVTLDLAQVEGTSVWIQQADGVVESIEMPTTEEPVQETPQKGSNGRLAAFDQYVDEEVFLNGSIQSGPWYITSMRQELVLYNVLHAIQGKVLIVQILCLLIGLGAVIMISLGAGWSTKTNQLQLCWYDKIPMEAQLVLFLIAAFFGFVFLVNLNSSLVWSYSNDLLRLLLPGVDTYPQLFAAAVGIIVAILLLMELFAWSIIFSFVRWAKQGNLFGGFWTFRVLKTVCSAVPLILQCTLLMVAAGVIQFFLTINSYWNGPFFALLFGGFVWLVTFICIAYAALCLQDLRRLAKAFLAGDYNAKPKFKYHYPIMQEIGEDICRVGDGMNVAVEQRIKSERMKTELITNVSHDLKTPLTSIINYTDLLQHEELPPQAAEYAEIIARQGERLHKLTVDLVDASKAASGVMSCTKAPTDVKELCEQAMGEYTERLTAVGLIPVLSMPEEDLVAQLDGRLTWRILDNLLSNACKYAQPGTRVYLVVSQQDSKVSLTLKNISRDPLNVPAEELMERFVRGDSARSSEGSGLGLSIARSLAELQGGSFNLYINGDLFQAQATFPLDQPQ